MVLQSFRISLDRTKEMSTYIIGLFDKYVEETSKLHSHTNNTHEAQMKSIEDFQMAYEVSLKPSFRLLLNLVGVYLIPSPGAGTIKIRGAEASRGYKRFGV